MSIREKLAEVLEAHNLPSNPNELIGRTIVLENKVWAICTPITAIIFTNDHAFEEDASPNWEKMHLQVAYRHGHKFDVEVHLLEDGFADVFILGKASNDARTLQSPAHIVLRMTFTVL